MGTKVCEGKMRSLIRRTFRNPEKPDHSSKGSKMDLRGPLPTEANAVAIAISAEIDRSVDKDRAKQKPEVKLLIQGGEETALSMFFNTVGIVIEGDYNHEACQVARKIISLILFEVIRSLYR